MMNANVSYAEFAKYMGIAKYIFLKLEPHLGFDLSIAPEPREPLSSVGFVARLYVASVKHHLGRSQ
jgi:hypothetical protein